jgi:hypothetical protein
LPVELLEPVASDAPVFFCVAAQAVNCAGETTLIEERIVE